MFGGYFEKDRCVLERWGHDERLEDNTIQCDFDRTKAPSLPKLWRVLRTTGILPKSVRYDRTNHGWHVIVEIWGERIPSAERVALQACMGSDPKRETLNLMRVINIRKYGASPFWQARWNLLFRKKLR